MLFYICYISFNNIIYWPLYIPYTTGYTFYFLFTLFELCFKGKNSTLKISSLLARHSYFVPSMRHQTINITQCAKPRSRVMTCKHDCKYLSALMKICPVLWRLALDIALLQLIGTRTMLSTELNIFKKGEI